MKFSNPFRKGNKMSEQNQNIENENPEVLDAENEETTPPTYEELQERIAELEGMLQDEKLRALANEQNLNRRFQEELQKTHKFATQNFAAEMLTVKDYLEMVLHDQSGNFDALKMGVSMTLNVLNQTFDKVQIKEIPAQKGDKLDPHKHNAMQSVESDDVEAGNIVSVRQKGYTMHDRVLRPATVFTAAAKTEAAE